MVGGGPAGGVLVVGGERGAANRGVVAARNGYLRGLLRSQMQEGSRQQEIPLKLVSAGAFRVVLRYLYTCKCIFSYQYRRYRRHRAVPARRQRL